MTIRVAIIEIMIMMINDIDNNVNDKYIDGGGNVIDFEMVFEQRR